MNVTCFKIALLLIGFGISLTCKAEDESTPSPNGSSTLPSPATVPIHAIDGMQTFRELFHVSDKFNSMDNNKISYKVTVYYPPNPMLADSLEKQYASLKDTTGLNRKASLMAYAERLRSGIHSAFVYTFYVSNTSKLMVEILEDDEAIKEYDKKIYFTGENIIELEPSAGIVTIFPSDATRYMGLVNNFPMLYGALGYIPDKLQEVVGNAPPILVVNRKNSPWFFLLKLDSSQNLAETDEILPNDKNLRVTKFQYSAQSHLWPSNIKADNFGSNGDLQGHEQWDLLKIESLPDGFDFSPTIEQTYRVVDETASKNF